jgi:hypothetical protein
LYLRLIRFAKWRITHICGFSGLTPYGLLLYIFNTAFIEWAGLASSNVVLAMNTGAIFHAPMFKFVVNACAASSFVVTHGVTPPVWHNFLE